jgi:hypothetical protein
MDEKKVTKQTLQEAQQGGRRLVYNKETGQFEVLKSYETVDPAKQTQMTPSNIPNALIRIEACSFLNSPDLPMTNNR